MPVSRNSITFEHRPVPTTEQLTRLVSSDNTTEQDRIRRKVTAVADIPTNTVLLYGDALEVARLTDALKSLDKVIQTCHLKTWVIFVRADRQKGYDVVANLLSGISPDPLGTIGSGIFNFTGGIDKLQFAISSNNTRGNLEIVDQPYMQLLHGTTSTIATLEEVAIPTTTISDGLAETSIQFKKVGLTIDVTPFFLAQDRVRLQVKQSNGVIGATREIGGNDIPEISTQSLETSAELRLGQVLLLGGVQSVSRETSKSFLSKRDDRQAGHLYVVCAVYSSIPKALPVIDLGKDVPLNPINPQDNIHFLDNGNLLPRWK
jgi:type II secretory pathway component GspD/PulD (secretin)